MSRLARYFLESESLSLINRLEQVQPFSLSMPMVAAAGVSDEASKAITDHLLLNVRDLRGQVEGFVRFLHSPSSAKLADDALQARYSVMKMRFNAILDQFDIFADVISQRAEHNAGIWVAGLDVLAADSLQLNGNYYTPPPVMCFLERGHGAAIRRARTRLPGGDINPVAIIQVPRERMVGSGIASSLIHEVGHQGAALLGLVESLREEMRNTRVPPKGQAAWSLIQLWISEIIADFWSMAHLGVGATLGLMGVVSLPRYFMFRVRGDDPHPFPWIRVKISLAFGQKLFPNLQWASLQQLWHRIYPTQGLGEETLQTIAGLELVIPRFVQLVTNHRSVLTKQRPLASLFPCQARQPDALRQLYKEWKKHPNQLPKEAPSLVFAVIGQARVDTAISAPLESRILTKLLTQWAWMRSENRTARRSPPKVLREMQKMIH